MQKLQLQFENWKRLVGIFRSGGSCDLEAAGCKFEALGGCLGSLFLRQLSRHTHDTQHAKNLYIFQRIRE